MSCIDCIRRLMATEMLSFEYKMIKYRLIQVLITEVDSLEI